MLPVCSCRCAVFRLFLCLCRWCAEDNSETETVKAEAEPGAVSCCGAWFDGWFTVAVGFGAELETEVVKAEAETDAVSCCGAWFDGWFTAAVGAGAGRETEAVKAEAEPDAFSCCGVRFGGRFTVAETEPETVAEIVCPCGGRFDRWRVRCVFLFFFCVWLPFVSCSGCVSNPAGSLVGVRIPDVLDHSVACWSRHVFRSAPSGPGPWFEPKWSEYFLRLPCVNVAWHPWSVLHCLCSSFLQGVSLVSGDIRKARGQ